MEGMPVPGRYIRSFDGLRALAIFLVMIFHGTYGLFPGGFLGVDLFFVLSGYLITSILYGEYANTGRISFTKFYTRRALRLFPVLIICILLSNLLWSYSVLDLRSDRTVASLAALFYFTNLVVDYLCGNMNHLWSLCVEEHFYVIWPLAASFFLFKLTDIKRINFLIVTIICLAIVRGLAYTFHEQLVFGIFWIDPYAFTLCRIDSILIGALLFFWISRRDTNNIPTERHDLLWIFVIFLFFIAFGLTVGLSNVYWLKGGFLISNLVCAWAVLIAIRNPNHPLLANKLMRWIGKRSYGIYAYHLPVFYALEPFREAHSIGNFVLVTLVRIALSLALAELSYEFIEQPILRYKNRYKVKSGGELSV
ncbi:MAG TPA: acyltransferase [Chryseolinea sp.]|nr:acyltransferase [Chryseolinea sp.]